MHTKCLREYNPREIRELRYHFPPVRWYIEATLASTTITHTISASTNHQLIAYCVPCWSQDDIGGHLREERDDWPSEKKGPVLSSRVSWLNVLGGNLHLGSISEPKKKYNEDEQSLSFVSQILDTRGQV